MRGKFKLSALLVLLFLASSCNDFVDINNDPNNPINPVLSLLLPATQMSLAAHFNSINSGGSAVMQHFASGTLNRWNQTGTSFSAPWSGFYTSTIPDLETIIREGTAQEAWGYVAIAKLEKAYLYSIMGICGEMYPTHRQQEIFRIRSLTKALISTPAFLH